MQKYAGNAEGSSMGRFWKHQCQLKKRQHQQLLVASDPGLCEESRLDGNQQTAASAASGLSEKPQEGNIKEVRLTCCLFHAV